MRHELKAMVGATKTFRAFVVRFSQLPPEKFVLMRNIFCGGELVADHIWLPKTGALRRVEVGQQITFKAKVIAYKKNFKGNPLYAQDYCLSAVREVEVYNQ